MNICKYLILFFTLFFIFKPDVSAQNKWVFLDSMAAGVSYYDSSSIVYDGKNDSYSGMSKLIHKEPVFSKDLNKNIEYIKVKWSLYCNNKMFNETEQCLYFDDGLSKCYDEENLTFPIPPGSPSDALYKIFCR